MKTAIISAVLTCGVIGGVIYVAALDNDRNPWLARLRSAPISAPEPSPTARRAPVAPDTVRSPDSSAHAPIDGVFKCVASGRTTYQDRPCTGRADAFENGTVSTVPAFRASPPLLASAENARPAVGIIERQEATEHDHWECSGLRREIKNIDAAARVRSTTELQERRRKAKRRMFDLKCAEIG